MKCVDCKENNAEEECDDCGEWYCKDCAEQRMGYCDCEIQPNIHPQKSAGKTNKTHFGGEE